MKNLDMSRPVALRFAATVIGLVLPAGIASADVVFTATGPGTATSVYQGPATFTNVSQAFLLVLDDTYVQKTVNSTSAPVVMTGTYVAGDVDYHNSGAGFRLTETITNNTGQAWEKYILTISSPGTFFTDSPVFSPSFVTATPGAVTFLTASGVQLNALKTTETYTFATPLLPGASFSIHAPIENLAESGSFTITQTAVVPTPSIAWGGAGLLVLGGIGTWLRRRQLV